jgi:hypothetical protein
VRLRERLRRLEHRCGTLDLTDEELTDEQLDARIAELRGTLVAAGCDPDTLTLESLQAEQAAERNARGTI